MPFSSFSSEYDIYIILAALWTLPWKGWALWKAANRREKGWFIALLIINTLGILEIFYIFFFGKENKAGTAEVNREIATLKTADAELEDRIVEAAKEWKNITAATAANLVKMNETEAEVLLENLRAKGKLRKITKKDGSAVYTPKNLS